MGMGWMELMERVAMRMGLCEGWAACLMSERLEGLRDDTLRPRLWIGRAVVLTADVDPGEYPGILLPLEL